VLSKMGFQNREIGGKVIITAATMPRIALAERIIQP
jgi:hypothetical protein